MGEMGKGSSVTMTVQLLGTLLLLAASVSARDVQNRQWFSDGYGYGASYGYGAGYDSYGYGAGYGSYGYGAGYDSYGCGAGYGSYGYGAGYGSYGYGVGYGSYGYGVGSYGYGADYGSGYGEGCTVNTGEYIRAGRNTPGGKALKSTGPLDCATKCLQDSKCQAWTLNIKSNRCWLKTTSKGRGSNKNWVWGLSGC